MNSIHQRMTGLALMYCGSLLVMASLILRSVA